MKKTTAACITKIADDVVTQTYTNLFSGHFERINELARQLGPDPTAKIASVHAELKAALLPAEWSKVLSVEELTSAREDQRTEAAFTLGLAIGARMGGAR